MSSINFAYREYNYKHHEDSLAAVLVSDRAFDNSYFGNSAITQTLFSVTGTVKKFLHFLHNEVAENIQKNGDQHSLVNGCLIAAVEIGLLATALTLAPMEAVIRTVIAVVTLPFLIIASMVADCLECPSETLNGLTALVVISLGHSVLHVPETAVSAFYSHLANYDTPIDYIGHGNCHVFCGSPTVTNPNYNEKKQRSSELFSHNVLSPEDFPLLTSSNSELSDTNPLRAHHTRKNENSDDALSSEDFDRLLAHDSGLSSASVGSPFRGKLVENEI